MNPGREMREELAGRGAGLGGTLALPNAVRASIAKAVTDPEGEQQPGEYPELVHPAKAGDAVVKVESAAEFDGAAPGALPQHREGASDASPRSHVAG
jgi:hypothetical protein